MTLKRDWPKAQLVVMLGSLQRKPTWNRRKSSCGWDSYGRYSVSMVISILEIRLRQKALAWLEKHCARATPC